MRLETGFSLMGVLPMNNSKITESISLIGVILSIFAFIFWPWDFTQSGFVLVFKLSKYFAFQELPLDMARKRAIFLILLGLAIILITQVVAVIGVIRAKSGKWATAEMGLSLVALILLIVLFFQFSARTEGVAITGMGEMLALGGSIALAYRRWQFFEFPERNKAIEKVHKSWLNRLVQAATSNTPVSILSIETSKFLGPSYVEMMIEELRANDAAYPLKDGIYVLLWKTEPVVAGNVARHLQNFMLENGQIQSWIGIASFPPDGDQINTLLEKANQALREARQSIEKSILAINDIK